MQISNGISKRDSRYFKLLNVNTDFGWFLKSSMDQTIVGIDSYAKDFSSIDKFKDEIYLENYFFVGKKINDYRENTKKFKLLLLK